MPDIKPVARKDIRALYHVQVKPDQEQFVAPNGLTMAQTPWEPGSEVFGIWEGEIAVGLLAIIDFSHPDAVLEEGEDRDSLYVWRLLIDEDHQRKGYGTAALNFAKQMMRDRGLNSISLGVMDKPGSAVPVYEREGFVRTGIFINGEAQMVWRP